MAKETGGGLKKEYQNYQRQKCFLAYSEKASWSDDLLSSLKEILNDSRYNLEIDYAREHFKADITLRQKALELIANARYGIYDISCWQENRNTEWKMPRNVFIELGIAIALNRPVLLLRHTSNQDLPLSKFLQCLSDKIITFSGRKTFRDALTRHLPSWIDKEPENAWWNRYCTLGARVCEYREAHPRSKQLAKGELDCIVMDGEDIDRDDFRSVVEDVLGRYRDVNYAYLDSLSLQENYTFLLCSLCQKVRSSPFSVYRITPKTPPEAYISIGMSLALESQFDYKISKILITKDSRDVPSLLYGYEVVEAKNDGEVTDNLKKFMPDIIDKVRATVWKSRPLPFLEISPAVTEQIETSDSAEYQTEAYPKIRTPGPNGEDWPVQVYPYGIHPPLIENVIQVMDLPVQLTKNLNDADAILALRSYLKDQSKLRHLARTLQIPIHGIKSNSIPQISRGLRRMLGLDDPHTETADFDLRLFSQSGTDDELEAMEEARLAVEQIVIPKSLPVELLPRPARIRKIQHQIVEEHYRLQSNSFGEEPNRRVRIYPA